MATETKEKSESQLFKEEFVRKVNSGDFSFNETQIRGLVAELGVEDDIDPAILGTREESPTAGATPATGSGGTPYEPDAATAETKKAAKEAEARLKKDDYPDATPVSPQRTFDKRLAASVKE